MRHLRSKEPMACYRSVRSQRFSTQMNRHASACGTGAKTIGGTVTGSTSGEHFGTSGALRHFGDSQLWSEVGDLRSAMKNGTPLVVSFDPNSFLLMRGRGHPGFLSGTLWFYWREYELLSQSRTSGHSGLSPKPTGSRPWKCRRRIMTIWDGRDRPHFSRRAQRSGLSHITTQRR